MTTEPEANRVGSTLRVKLEGSWREATRVGDDGLDVEWETVDGRRGWMTARLWDLNKRRQALDDAGGEGA